MQILALSGPEDLLRGLWGSLCQFIYGIISWLYELFMNLSRIQILTEGDIKPLYQRLTMILTIVMVFYVTFEVVKYVIQPEQFSDKEKGGGKLAIKMILVVILIAFVPQIFSLASKVQNVIFDNQVFSKIILGQPQVDTEKFGRVFSSNVLGMFYYVDEMFEDQKEEISCEGVPCINVVNLNLNSLVESGNLPLLHLGLTSKGETSGYGTDKTKVEAYYIHFDGLFAVAVGGFIAYMLIMYCIDVGTRVAQLAFLQIIAPIPIIGFLSPKKDGIFQKWTQQCITTYLDLFIRVGIIYFVLLICQMLGNAYSTGTLLNNIGDVTPFMKMIIYIALILGLLVFAQRAPKMLGELFPKMGAASGNFGLKGKERGLSTLGRVVGGTVGGAAGAVAGAVTGAAQGWKRRKAIGKNGKEKGVGAGIWGATKGVVGGLVGGATRGVYNGAKKSNNLSDGFKNTFAGAQNQIKANQRFGNREASGYTLGHQIEDKARGMFGFNSRIQAEELKKAPIKRQQDAYANLTKANDDIRDYAWKKAQDGKSASIAQYKAVEGRIKKLSEATLPELAEIGIESEEARKAALKTAIEEQKKLKDKATDEFINGPGANDGGLQNMIAARDAEVKNYNKYAASDKQIPTEVEETFTYKDHDGNIQTVNKGDNILTLSAQAMDEYNKIVLKNKQAELGRNISEITAQQEAIKRETEGSGINDSKK